MRRSVSADCSEFGFYLIHSFHRRKANTSIQCPVDEGTYTITHTVKLPKEIPPGKLDTYTVIMVDAD